MIKLDYLPYVPSPNKSVRTVKPTWIVVHAMAGFYTGSISWFKNPKSQVSAHYLVNKKGEITNMVKDEHKAWHCFNFNNQSIGIELEDKDLKTGKICTNDPKWCTEKEYEAAAELVATLMLKHKIPLTNVIGHNDPKLKKLGSTHEDPGPYFDWVKFRALVTKFLGETKGDEKA